MDELIKRLRKYSENVVAYKLDSDYASAIQEAANAIEELQADVRPVVRGKWIMNDECRTVCSLCGNVIAFVSHPDRRWDFGNFCPNCGADMREGS